MRVKVVSKDPQKALMVSAVNMLDWCGRVDSEGVRGQSASLSHSLFLSALIRLGSLGERGRNGVRNAARAEVGVEVSWVWRLGWGGLVWICQQDTDRSALALKCRACHVVSLQAHTHTRTKHTYPYANAVTHHWTISKMRWSSNKFRDSLYSQSQSNTLDISPWFRPILCRCCFRMSESHSPRAEYEIWWELRSGTLGYTALNSDLALSLICKSVVST